MPVRPLSVCVFVSLALIVAGCGPSVTPPSPGGGGYSPGGKTRVYWVSPYVLYRDHGTSKNFEGQWVRVALAPADYVVRGTNEIVVFCADNGQPPAIVFRLSVPLVFTGKNPSIVVTGFVVAVTRDGVWRSRLVDFFVTVDDARVEVVR